MSGKCREQGFSLSASERVRPVLVSKQGFAEFASDPPRRARSQDSQIAGPSPPGRTSASSPGLPIRSIRFCSWRREETSRQL